MADEVLKVQSANYVDQKVGATACDRGIAGRWRAVRGIGLLPLAGRRGCGGRHGERNGARSESSKRSRYRYSSFHISAVQFSLSNLPLPVHLRALWSETRSPINTIRKATVAYPTIKRLFDPHCSRYDPSKALENPCVDVIKRALKHRVRGFPNLC